MLSDAVAPSLQSPPVPGPFRPPPPTHTQNKHTHTPAPAPSLLRACLQAVRQSAQAAARRGLLDAPAPVGSTVHSAASLVARLALSAVAYHWRGLGAQDWQAVLQVRP